MKQSARLETVVHDPAAQMVVSRYDWSDMAFRHRLTARAAVGAARLLARQSPARIHAVLGVLRRGAAAATYEQARRARREVVTVSRWCAGEGCLPRSLATVLLCRVRGGWPTWCTGTRTFPFTAHAWVEAEGWPVDEPPGTDRYLIIMSVAPHGPSQSPLPTHSEAGDVRS